MGKARGFSSSDKDAVYQTEYQNEIYSAAAQQNSYNLGSTHFSDQSGIGNFNQSGSDQRKASVKGALFQGNVGFIQQTALLDVPTSTIDLWNDSSGTALSLVSTDRFVTLSTGTTSDLVTITGAQRPGQRLVLYNTLTNTITIKHTAAATSNTIRTPDGLDFSFLGNAVVELVYDLTSAQWRIISGGTGGSGGLTEPIVLTINTITPQTLPTTSVVDWSKNPNHITIDRAVDFSFSNLPASGSYEGVLVIIDIDGTGGYASPTWPASVTNPPVVSTVASSRTSVMLYTIDGGTVVTHATSVGSSNASLSQWATFPAVTDVDFATFDGLNIDRLRFIISSGAPSSPGDPSIYLDSTGDMLSNVATGDRFFWTVNDVDAFSMSLLGGSLDPTFTVHATDDQTPALHLQRLDSTPSVGAAIGRIHWFGVDSSGVTVEEFARVTVDSEDLTIGSVDGSMHLEAFQASVPVTFLSLNNSNDNKVSLWKNIFMQTGIDIEMVGNDLWLDSGLTTKLSGSATGFNVNVGGVFVATFGTTGMQMQPTFDIFTRAVGYDPTTATFLADGTIWYSSTLSKFQARENGVTVNLIGGSGSQTPILQDVDYDGFDILDLGRIEFRDDAVGAAAATYIVTDGINLRHNVPLGDGHLFTIDGTQKLGIGASQVNIFQELDMNTFKVVEVVDPTNPQDAATKNYVDGASVGFQDYHIWITHETTQFDFEVFMTNSKTGGEPVNASLTEDTLIYVPFWLGQRARLSELGFETGIDPTGTYTVAMGIYTNRTDGQNYPQTKLDDGNTVHSGVGAKVQTGFAEDLEVGLYWLAIVCTTDDVTIHHYNSGDTLSVGSRLNTTGTDSFDSIRGYTEAHTSTTLPTTADDEMLPVGLIAPALYGKFVLNPN